MNIYLDNAATKPLSSEMKEYLISLLDIYGNPSSSYSLGQKSKQLISTVRMKVANFINADINNIYFTCGGSASNTLGIKGFISKNDYDIFYSPVAHKSILNMVKDKQARQLKVNSCGMIDLNDLEQSIIGRRPFVIIDYANSEIGTIQDVKSIIDIVHFYKGIIYLDCTGSIPTIPLDVKALDIDICGFSGHKLGALKGCGVLYKKETIDLEPLIYGAQEHGLVGGTENILGIASLGKAIDNYNYSHINTSSRDYVHDYIIKNITESYLVGSKLENRLSSNLYICFKGIEGESLMILLDMNGIQVSTGSACNSIGLSTLPTLLAIEMDKHDLHSCIRMTFTGNETKEQLDYVCSQIKMCVDDLRLIDKQNIDI